MKKMRVVLMVLVAAVLVFGIAGYVVAAELTDIDGHDYEGAILAMTAHRLAGGYADDTFRPDNPLQRQQFAKMAVLTLDYPVTTANVSTFADTPAPYDAVNNPLYPGSYVAVAAANHIINGYTNGSFGFTDNVTRQQVISIAVRAARDVLDGVSVPADWQGVLDYSDPNHGTNIKMAEYAGLLSGIKDLATWNLKANATRGEACEIMAQVYFRTGNILKMMGPSGSSGAKGFTLAELKALTATEGYGATKNEAGTMSSAKLYKGVAIKDLMALVGGGTTIEAFAADGYKVTYTADQVNGVVQMFNPATGDDLATITGPMTMILAYESEGKPFGTSDGPLRIVFVTPTAEQATMSSLWARSVLGLLAN
jgi:hypothetical protein